MGDSERESRIIDAARAGDKAAWELLYRRVYPRLQAYLVRRVGSEQAEDAVSETMARAIAGLDKVELGSGGFDGWVFGIARHVAADVHRRTGRSERYAIAGFIASESSYRATEPGEEIFLAEDQRRISVAFRALSPPERELLDLRVVADLSVEETAAALGKRPGAVRTAQSRAIAHLRRLMEQLDV